MNVAISEQTFYLDPAFDGPLQRQLQQIVTSGILGGRMRPGDRMPSSRKLAVHLGISRITVTLAYTELVANDYLTSRGRSGYFVSTTAPRAPAFPLAKHDPQGNVDWARAIGQRFTSYASLVRPTNWRRYPYPFIYGQTDATLFDHRNWRSCAVQALGQRDFDALTSDYYERDDPMLVEYILSQILPRRGINADASQVLLTLGAQNALWISAQILLTQRRSAVMENPCYPGLREILSQTRCNRTSLDVDQDGLNPDLIPASTDVVFITPSHHCPTSATLPPARRRALLDRAERDNFIVVEDDYEFEMSFLEPPVPALKSHDTAGRVVYLGSFSKSVFPGLRLGYLVGPEPFIREARALRALVLRHPPGHIQRTAAYFLSMGHYDAQIRRMGAAFNARRKVMDQAIRANGLTIAGRDHFGGSSLWMKAPDGVNTSDLARRLHSNGVLIEPGRVFFDADTPNDRYYRLAYSSIASERIPEGIARIGMALGEADTRS